MRLRKYEIRMSVSKTLYDHIFQEAKWRDTNMANIVREQLAKYYFQRESITNSHETSNIQQENHSNKTISKPSMETEKKLFSAVSKIEKRFELVNGQIDLVIAMLDRFYFDIMKFLPNIPEELSLAAVSIAHQRHIGWLETIKQILEKNSSYNKTI